ncbi:hypothetical protein BJV77DRAFT_688769 [Russula vinacea]|nr:hypothetical protein BJV77DRAFT_688769 [Russula vinacea]
MSSSDEVLKILDDPDADIILCSREHHKFRVLKLHSSCLIPVLSFPVFLLYSPHGSCTPFDSRAHHVLLSTAQKYQMDSILSRIRAMIALQIPPLIRRETAFQVYYLARMHGLRQEALQAARTTLIFPFTFEDLEDELEAIHGIYLHELWKYYQSVRTHLKSCLEAFRATGMPALTCPPCGSNTIHGARIWLDDYVASIAESPALFDLTEFYACFSRHIIQNDVLAHYLTMLCASFGRTSRMLFTVV